MFIRRALPRLGSLFLLLLLASVQLKAQKQRGEWKKGQWPPIPAEELALKEVPGVPGAHAILLYRESHTDDNDNSDLNFFRIKVLSEEGKKYADIEIPYIQKYLKIEDIEARTVKPDSTAVNFQGQIFDKTVVKARGIKYMAKSFPLPEVQVGRIIEYRYTRKWDPQLLLGTHWLIQHPLFTRRAKFSLRPQSGRPGYWASFGMPDNIAPRLESDRLFRLEMENIAALEEESYMPPEAEVQMRVEFYYPVMSETAEDYWGRVGKELHEYCEKFIDKKREMEQAARSLVAPGDSDETKLRKIYARVQQVRNLSFEQSRTDEDEKRDKLKGNKDVQDVWERGYGHGFEINMLFTALARGAGFEAGMRWLASRRQNFFHPQVPNARQLNANVAAVRLNGKDFYADPATKFCPYGLLPWEETGAGGLRPAKEGGILIMSPEPKSSEAFTERRAALRLEADGTIKGDLEVVYSSREALQRRLDARDDDETARKKDLEEECKNWLVSGAKVTLVRAGGWESPETPLSIGYKVEIPGYAASTGRRQILPAAVFQSGRKNPFQHAERKFPVYFTYPWVESDDLKIELPAGYQIESLPETRSVKLTFGNYEIKREIEKGKLRVRRQFEIQGVLYPKEYYPAVREFFNVVKTGDEENVVLQSGGAPPKE